MYGTLFTSRLIFWGLIITEELALCFDRWILTTFQLLLLRLFQATISDISKALWRAGASNNGNIRITY